MPHDFFGIFIGVVLILVLLAFASFIIRTKSSGYQDWKKEQNRLKLRAMVQKVREEMGDYDPPVKRPALKKRAM